MFDGDDDPLSPAHLADPYPLFNYLRAHDPVHWNERYRAWFVHRHDDVIHALRHPEDFSSDRVWPVFDRKLTPAEQEARRPSYDILGEWLVFRDPPDHTRLRRLVAREFSPRSVERWRPRVEAVVADLIDDLADRKEMDVIRDFGFPIPAVVIAEMLGVPPADRDLFKAWSDDLMTVVFGARGQEDRRARAQESLLDMSAYLNDLVIGYRKRPDDNLMSGLIAAQDEDGDVLSDDEIIANCILFLFGGHETTTNLIGNGLRLLMLHPAALERLRAEPNTMKQAIEELLRYDGPSKMEIRIASRESELGGKQIRAGDMVHLVQSAANRDPEVFHDPDVLDLERDVTGHIAFGFGAHYCLGAPLARLEGSVALSALIRHLSDFEFNGAEEWVPTMVSRGMRSFPVRYSYREPSSV